MTINSKRIAAVFLTVLFTPLIVTGVPAISMSSETTTVKDIREVKADKQVEQEKEVKQEKKELEAKPKFDMGKEVKEQKNPYANAEITTKIIPAAKNTFGYDILLYGRPLVHQPHIPGLPGNEGFTTKEKAQKVADFVVKKIRRNEMPPTVTIDDLNNMGVLKSK